MMGIFNQYLPMILLHNQWCYSMPTFLPELRPYKVPRLNRYQFCISKPKSPQILSPHFSKNASCQARRNIFRECIEDNLDRNSITKIYYYTQKNIAFHQIDISSWQLVTVTQQFALDDFRIHASRYFLCMFHQVDKST